MPDQIVSSIAICGSRVRYIGLRGLSLIALMMAFGTFGAAHAESLHQALTATYDTNPRLQAERANLRAIDEEVARARSGFRPDISGTAQVGHQDVNSKPNLGTSGTTQPYGYSGTVSQPIFSGLSTVHDVRESQALVFAGREVLLATQQAVLLEAVTAYADVYRDQSVLTLRRRHVSILNRDLSAAQTRFNAKDVTKTDVLQARSRRARARAAVDEATINIQSAQARFEEVVGHDPDGISEPTIYSQLIPSTMKEAIDIASRENPAVVEAHYRELASRHSVQKIRGELLPQISVDANYDKQYDTSRITNETETTSIFGRLQIPFYKSGETRARIRQAKHTVDSRLKQIRDASRQARSDVISSWSAYVGSRRQIQGNRDEIVASRGALKGTRKEEKNGQRLIVDVLNAEQELVDSQIQMANTQRELVVNSYILLASLGRLNAMELGLDSSIYNPDDHYRVAKRKWWTTDIAYPNGQIEQIE